MTFPEINELPIPCASASLPLPKLYCAAPELVRSVPEILKLLLKEIHEAGAKVNRDHPAAVERLRDQQGLLRSGGAAVVGEASSVEELPGFETVIGGLQLGGLLVVGMAEHRLQLVDQAGVGLRRLLVGRCHEPFAPGVFGIGALHRRRDGLEVAGRRELIPPALQPMSPSAIELL